MALFKIFGNFASGNTTLPTSTTQGYCYFDKNTGKFYIDTATSETAELGTNRLALNADKADKDGAGNSIINTYLTKETGVTDVTYSNYKLQKTINGATTDVIGIPITLGTGTGSAIGGNRSTATGTGALAFGYLTRAQGNYSVAFGQSAKAMANYSSAYGSMTTVEAVGGFAAGSNVQITTNGTYSFATGVGTIASSGASFVCGSFNIEDANDNYALIIGNGTDNNNRSNAMTISKDGDITTSNIHLLESTHISNTGVDADPAFISWNDNYLKLRFNDEESNSIELGNNGLIINDGTGVGNNGQALLSDGTKAYWGTVSTEDTKVNVSTRGTTKAYLLADTTAPTSTAAAHTAVAESDVYLDTTAGALAATTYKIAEAVTLQYNSTTQALDFIFA